MIVRERPSGLKLFLVAARLDPVPHLARAAGELVVVAVGVTLSHGAFFQHKITLTAIPLHADRLAAGHLPGLSQYRRLRPFLGRPQAVGRPGGTQPEPGSAMPRPDCRARRWHRRCPGPGWTGVRVRMISRAMAYAYALRNRLRGSSADAGLGRSWLRPAGACTAAQHQRRPAADDGHGRGSGPLRAARPCRSLPCRRHRRHLVAHGGHGGGLRSHPQHAHPLLIHAAAALRTAYLYFASCCAFGLKVDAIGFCPPIVVAIVAIYLLRPRCAGR
ncbi:hypothetical protein ACU4GD_41660 [Cupriavidus basilensis]